MPPGAHRSRSERCRGSVAGCSRHGRHPFGPPSGRPDEARACTYYTPSAVRAHGTMAAMRVGLSIDPPLATIPATLAEEGVDAFQTVLRDPGRFGNYGVPDAADRTALIEGSRGRGLWGVAHGSLLINLASPEGASAIRRSRASWPISRSPPRSASRRSAFTSATPRAIRARTRRFSSPRASSASSWRRCPTGRASSSRTPARAAELGQTIPEIARLVRDVRRAARPPRPPHRHVSSSRRGLRPLRARCGSGSPTCPRRRGDARSARRLPPQ